MTRATTCGRLYGISLLIPVAILAFASTAAAQYVEDESSPEPAVHRTFASNLSAQAGAAVSFSSSGLQGESLSNPTSLEFGPDGRLYVSQQNGTVFAYGILRVDVDDYQVVSTETINLVKTGVPNHNDDGSPNSTQTRQVTGLLVTGTAANPVLYVTSSDWRIGAGGGGTDTNLDTNSGVVSRLTCAGGVTAGTCLGWDKVDIVRGLPRSEENHSTNGLDLDEATNTLYVIQGGHANKGAPSNNFAGTPEFYLSGALLSVDLDAIDAMPVYTDPRSGTDFVYDLRTLDDPTRANIDNSHPDFPYTSGHPLFGSTVDLGDPFGGNNGLNQAIPEPGGPVQIFSPGFRNAYDVVFTENGRLYTSDNGPNSGWGGQPFIYDSGNNLKGVEGFNSVTYNPASGDYCTNEFNESGDNGHGDPLHFIPTEGYYGGHPAPIRAFPGKSKIIVYEKDSSGWSAVATHDFYDLLPSDLDPADYPSNPVECGYSATSGVIDIVNASTNGIAEYTASNFDGAMLGNLLTASFNGTIYRYVLTAAGDAYAQKEALFGGFGSTPLDVTAQGDGDPFAGTIWGATYGSDDITIFEPVDFGACDVSDPNADADDDGYTNDDEDQNGTNPCSSASKPDDADGDLVSDLLDADDDNDGLADVVDPFAIDPNNGLATSVPVDYPLYNESPGTGFFGVGFTGLMTNGTTDYLDQFDPEKLAAGGASGLFTVEEVTHGDAFQGENANDNAFQFGIDVDTSTPPFIIQTRLLPPYFGGLTPQDWQSFGLQLGAGNQNNFLKIVFNANGGNGGVEVAKEVGGSAAGTTYTNSHWGGTSILASGQVDLFAVVDPQALTVQPKISLDQGATVFDLGAPVGIPAAWLDPNDDRGLAVGMISTANSPGDAAPTFAATWDLFKVTSAPSNTRALVQVTPSGGLNASTFGANSFVVENQSVSANITSVTFDVATAVLPDVVFDPDGTAGDATAKGFTPDTQSGGDNSVGITTHSFGDPHDGGYRTLTINFSDFEPGEVLKFSVDMDPTSINGTTAPGPGESGSISGLELSGTGVTVSFDDASVFVADLVRGPGATNGGSETVARSPLPGAPTIGVDGLSLSTPAGLPAHFLGATTAQTTQTIHVEAPIGATVRLVEVDAALFEPTTGGNDIDEFEANSVTAVAEQSAIVSDPAGLDFTVSLTAVDANSSASTTLNYFLAVIEDPSDGATGPTSDVVILEYDPSAAPSPLYRVNAGGSLISATDTGPDWETDTNASPSSYVTLGTCANCKKTSNHGAVNSLDPSVPAGTPASLFETERWDHPDAPPMQWDFPVSNGEYVVRLYLANGYAGTSEPGQRVFDVAIEGVTLIDGLDLSGQYGHKVGVMLEFPVSIADGNIDIEFIHDVENPLVNAIEILGYSEFNLPPQVTALGNQTHLEGATPDLSVTATDPDGDNLSYSATGLPDGLAIESTNGHIFGTIADGAAANSPFAVTISVSDGVNDPVEFSFTWTVIGPLAADVIYRVNNGGPEVADTPIPWGEDQSVATAGGTAQTGTPSIYLDLTGAAVDKTFGANVTITNATGAPSTLFLTERYSDAPNPDNMKWDFPVTAGQYEVNLYFAETWSGAASPGVRVFDVFIEGVLKLDDYDPYVAAGNAIDTATKESFVVDVADSNIDIDFVKIAQNPAVKAIEIRSLGGSANAAPVIDAIDDVAVSEGDPVNVSVTATDVDSDPIALSIAVVDDGTSTPVDPAGYTFTDNGDGTGSFSWTPQNAGSFTATVTAGDGTSSSTEAFGITVSSPGGTPSATLTVNGGGGLFASTFGDNSFVIANTGDVAITGVSIDLSTGFLPDVVFDPVGTAGDSGAKCLTPGTGSAAVGFVAPSDPCVDPFSQPHNLVDGADGFDVVTLAFGDFGTSESFGFAVDLDPTSIKGDQNTGDAGAISGLEIVGARVTVTFADASVLEAHLFDEGSLGGSKALVAPSLPAPAPAIAVDGIASPPAVVANANQTIVVTGTPGDEVTLLRADARLYVDDQAQDPDADNVPGYDIEPFEANEVLAKQVYSATIGSGGSVDVPVVLTKTTSPNAGPDAGLNYFIAAVEGAGGLHSATSNVVVLEYDPTFGQDIAISGTVAHRDAASTPLEGASVSLSGDAVDVATTVADGSFSFDVDDGGSYTVSATYGDASAIDAITTLDLALMRLHVLNTSLLSDPLAIISADVNESASVTTLDIALAQQVILRTTSSFAAGFWNCVTAGQSFGDPPFPYETTHSFASIDASATADFTCFVRGDVNASWQPPSAGKSGSGIAEGEMDGGPPVRFAIDAHTSAPGAELVVPIRVESFSDVGGFQFTLEWDPKVLDFQGIEPSMLPGLSASNFGTHRSDEGILTAAWTDPYGESESLDDGAEVVALRFLVVGSEGMSTDIDIGSAVTRAFAHRGETMLPVRLDAVSGRVATRQLPAEFVLEQAYPNPFNPQATIPYALPEAAHVRIEVFDAVGRLVNTLVDGSMAAGRHEAVFDASGLPSGVYFYRIEAGSFRALQRVTLIK